CELYPQRRATEYYRTPQQRASRQSRQAEHPRDFLNVVPPRTQERTPPEPRIQPANNPDMGTVRNSYFS
ncbi:hypothetical protein KR074_001858, partial [Drosophila pseudoananassae]